MLTLTCCQDHILTENIWFETSYSGDERRCNGCGTNNQTVKIELLSQWKLEAEFRNSYLRMKRRMPGDEGRPLPCITPPLCPGKTKGIETYFILCPKNATSLLPPHYPSVRAGGGQPEVTARVPIPPLPGRTHHTRFVQIYPIYGAYCISFRFNLILFIQHSVL